jgi:SHS2 domain-containing protein
MVVRNLSAFRRPFSVKGQSTEGSPLTRPRALSSLSACRTKIKRRVIFPISNRMSPRRVGPGRIEAMRDFELLEHTADVGMRVRGPTLAAVIERATVGLAEIAGLWRPGGDATDGIDMGIEARDPGAVLVDWLNEVLYALEVRAAALCGVTVWEAGVGSAAGRLLVGGLEDAEIEGTPVKAATLHGLDVRADDGGWIAVVYLDI